MLLQQLLSGSLILHPLGQRLVGRNGNGQAPMLIAIVHELFVIHLPLIILNVRSLADSNDPFKANTIEGIDLLSRQTLDAIGSVAEELVGALLTNPGVERSVVGFGDICVAVLKLEVN